MSRPACTGCCKLFVLRTQNGLACTPVSANAFRQLVSFILDYRENNLKSLLLNVRELQMLWDLLSGFVWCVLAPRLLVSLNGPPPGCAVFASVFPLLRSRLRLAVVHRILHPRETAFAPFSFLTSTYCGYSYIINVN